MKRAFTLIELLVVISIISLLSSIVMSSLNSARASGRDAARIQNLRQVQIAIEQYIAVNGEAPGGTSSYGTGSWEELPTLLAPYISKLPDDPCRDCKPNFKTAYYRDPGTYDTFEGIRLMYRKGPYYSNECRSQGICPGDTSYALFYNAYETYAEGTPNQYVGVSY